MANFLKKIIRNIYYFGWQRHCVFCGRNARKFVNRKARNIPVIEQQKIVGMGSRSNCYCPWCGSKDRERLAWFFLSTNTELCKKENISVLHIAPEKNLKNKIQSLNVSYIAGDKFTPGYRYPSDTIDLDITELSFQDNSFDLVICNHVLEHVENDLTAMSEIYRVLKSGGGALLQVPVSYELSQTKEILGCSAPSDREMEYGQSDHVRIYGRDYPKRLKEAGFEVQEYTPAVLGFDVKTNALNPEERIYFATKPVSTSIPAHE